MSRPARENRSDGSDAAREESERRRKKRKDAKDNCKAIEETKGKTEARSIEREHEPKFLPNRNFL